MKNEKGFVLAETLVVAVAVMTIFSLLYANYYPLIGEYEKREVYDNIDSKYIAHWVRKILIEKSTNPTLFTMMNSCDGNCHVVFASFYEEHKNSENKIIREKKVLLDKTDELLGDNASYLQNYIDATSIKAILITNYNIESFKTYVKDHKEISVPSITEEENFNKKVITRGFRDYIEYLPKYNKTPSQNGASHRVIVIIDHNTSKEYDSYATIEVKI